VRDDASKTRFWRRSTSHVITLVSRLKIQRRMDSGCRLVEGIALEVMAQFEAMLMTESQSEGSAKLCARSSQSGSHGASLAAADWEISPRPRAFSHPAHLPLEALDWTVSFGSKTSTGRWTAQSR
jgi:hypothetical protein